MIAGGMESWKLADRLQKENVPVLLSLNFPKRTTASLPEADPESLRRVMARYFESMQAVIEQGNVFGTQFHPEKSQLDGLKLLGNFLGQ